MKSLVKKDIKRKTTLPLSVMKKAVALAFTEERQAKLRAIKRTRAKIKVA